MKSTTTAIAYTLLIATFTNLPLQAGTRQPTYTLQSQRSPGQTDKVTVLMEVSGEFKDRPAAGKDKEERVAMNGTCRLSYWEKTLAAKADSRRSVRYYETARADVKFKDGAHQPSLSAERRLIGAAVDESSGATLFSLGDPLSRDELELIDMIGNSLVLDDLLPSRPVTVGDTWKPSDKTVAMLLGLDEVTRCQVQCSLKEAAKSVARIDLSGSVTGKINDTTTRIELKGKYRFDLKARRIDWFALVTREDRGISQAASGFNVGVRLQMTITPSSAPPQLSATKLADADLEPTAERSRLGFHSPRERWQITYDRRWHLNSDDRDAALLKWIDQGAMAGQCNIASLAQRDPDKLVTLEEFQEDIRRALGKNFGEFVEAKQSINASGLRVLRVVAQGVAKAKGTELPIRWVYYHVADRQGRQVALTFTVEQESAKRFGDADREIVDSLRFAQNGKSLGTVR